MLCEHGNAAQCASMRFAQSCNEHPMAFLTAKIMTFSLHREVKPYAVWKKAIRFKQIACFMLTLEYYKTK